MKYFVNFSVNDEEYTTRITVQARSLKQIDNRTVLADGVRIETGEHIVSVKSERQLKIEQKAAAERRRRNEEILFKARKKAHR